MTVLPSVDKKEDPPDELALENEEDDVIFDQTPVRVLCPHCGGAIITFIEYESSWVTYTAALVIWIVLGWAALCVVPVVWPLFKDVVHHCPRCLNVLATKSRVVIPSFRQPVMTFKVGSCAVVLARKYVLFLCGLISVILCIHFVRTNVNAPTPTSNLDRTNVSSLRWEDFLKDCGYRSYLGNPIHVTAAFEEKYKNRTFHWQGVVKRYADPFSFLGLSQQGQLYVRMEPSQYPNSRDLADLVLHFDAASQPAKELAELSKRPPNTGVNFEATMFKVGKRGAAHNMALWSVYRLDDPANPFANKTSGGG